MLSKSQTDQLKGMSIILVMAGHLITLNKLSLPQELRFLATFSVDVFLLISGYGLTKSFISKGLKGFFTKRVLNVAIPFIIANVLIYTFYGHDIYKLTDFLRTITFNMFYLKLDGTMWFIYFIILWYAFFWIVFSIPCSLKIKALLLMAVSIAIHLYSPRLPYPTLASQFSLHAFSFPIGIAIAAFNKGDNVKNSLLASIFATLFALSYYSIFQGFSMQKYVACCALYGIAASFSVSILNPQSRILDFFGRYSYEAYLVEGILFRFSYSNHQILNALVFFALTMLSAVYLKHLHKLVVSSAIRLVKRF